MNALNSHGSGKLTEAAGITILTPSAPLAVIEYLAFMPSSPSIPDFVGFVFGGLGPPAIGLALMMAGIKRQNQAHEHAAFEKRQKPLTPPGPTPM